MIFLHSEENSSAIKDLLKNEGDIRCAVSFWGVDALNYISGDKKRYKIICNLESGATNPHLIKKLIQEGAEVKTNSKLHAKVYIAEDQLAIVGSSNASANGLSLENDELKGWIEASFLVDSSELVSEISDWFDSQWKTALPVTDELLKIALAKWGKRRNNRGIVFNDGDSLLDALKKFPESFADKNIYISIYRISEASNEALEVFEDIKTQPGIVENISFWENWPDFPRDSISISVYYGPRGGFQIDGYYYVPSDDLAISEDFRDSNNEQGNILIIFLRNSIEGLTLSEEDVELIRANIEALYQSGNPQEKKDSVLIALNQARDILFS